MDKLVDELVRRGVLKTSEIIEAFRCTDRGNFVLDNYRQYCYADAPLPIGYGQTISQPSTVGFMVELLSPKNGEKILDVGSGSGWTTALLGRVVGNSGKVIGVERLSSLVELGNKNIQNYSDLNLKIVESKKELGYRDEAPFDKILVSAAADNLPSELVDQLKVGGRMVIPIGYSLWRVDRVSDTESEKKEFPGYLFVPLL